MTAQSTFPQSVAASPESPGGPWTASPATRGRCGDATPRPKRPCVDLAAGEGHGGSARGKKSRGPAGPPLAQAYRFQEVLDNVLQSTGVAAATTVSGGTKHKKSGARPRRTASYIPSVFRISLAICSRSRVSLARFSTSTGAAASAISSAQRPAHDPLKRPSEPRAPRPSQTPRAKAQNSLRLLGLRP
jgi:hypothetical protein